MVFFQLFGLALGLAGAVTGYISVRSHHFSFAHGIIGLIVIVMGALQPLIAFT